MQFQFFVYRLKLPWLYRDRSEKGKEAEMGGKMLKNRVGLQVSLSVEAPIRQPFGCGEFVQCGLVGHEHLFFSAKTATTFK